jgi:hypothetical protein
MPAFRHSWLYPSRVVLVEFDGDLSFEELEASHRAIIENFFNAGQAPVHLVIDIDHLKSFPTNLIKVQQITRPVLGHPAIGWMIMVGTTNALQRFLLTTITQLANIRTQQTSTLDEARAALERLDPSLT